MSSLTPVAVPTLPAISTTDAPRVRLSPQQTTSATNPAQTVASDTVEQLTEVQQAIERLKQSLKPALSNTLQFQIDKGTGKTIVKIIDAETQTVVRQIPSEEILAISEAIDRMQNRGVLVQQRA